MNKAAFVDLRAQQQRLDERIPQAIQKVLDHGQYILGPEVRELEHQLARFSGARHVISCASGTDALIMALMARGTGPGDAVFVPAFTFVATAEAVALVGATPVFVDVEPDSFLLDLASLDAALETATRTGLAPKGIIPVDLFGQPCVYKEINAYARERGLFVIADAAQSFGARLDGNRVGTLAEVTATSFFPAKPLGCYGDGGALFTDDEELADRLRSLRVHGKGAHKYDNVHIGVNGRLDTIQAAILLEKLPIFEEEITLRNRVARRYGELLDDLVVTPALRAGVNSVWAQYTIVTPALRAGVNSVWAQYTIQSGERDAIAQELKRQGIPSAVYYPAPLHRQTAYKDYPHAPDLAVSERLCAQVLSLPMHPYLEEEAQGRICDIIRQAL
ncbi:MAG: DegT/DnrJ/EryC1/StrS aminotransferase family protein [Gammaproteobacteria bacterium]|nr:DegT/DnrJ/EryC1/StrS aminotransferase family protein [Gammaproteobacteria bacterium]